ncbi:MAG TPA: 23S rRNA (adenine(2503)-C(2))-methyltransferase RlmN [Terriglobales bacterium]|jgi:23S rRNA (adenine2503-C2)-methyltransferase
MSSTIASEAPATQEAPEALALSPEELAEQLPALRPGRKMPRYRGAQIFHALHQEYAGDWEAVQTLPAEARSRLGEHFRLNWPRIAQRFASVDGTIRYLLELADGATPAGAVPAAPATVEAVYLPDEVFDRAGASVRRRTTFCISTQVGCAVNCQFCLTATLGLMRSLTAGEIVGQVLTLLREHELRPGKGLDRVNLVLMGMGEPFLNYENVVRALRLLTLQEGAGLAPRRITVSTSGIVDKIRRWGQEGVETFPRGRPRLAISLNAPTDAQRQAIMPLNRGQGGLAALLAAVRTLPQGPREYVTFEYVLLAGVNDSLDDAARLLALVAEVRCKINLIAWNMGPSLPFRTPAPEQVLAFQSRLVAGGVATYIRRPRGQDIYAACGQLFNAGTRLTPPARARGGAGPRSPTPPLR